MAQFNGVVRWICYEIFGEEVHAINVNTARKNVGLKIDKKDKSKTTKEKVLEQVQQLDSKIIWPERTLKSGPRKGLKIFDDCCYDMADAWVIGKAFLLEKKENIK